MKQATETVRQVWAERIRAWRNSGLSAEKFAQNEACAKSGLYYWEKRLRTEEQGAVEKEGKPGRGSVSPRLVQVLPRAQTPGRKNGELMVEVENARIHVGVGFDVQLLAEVVRVLRGGAR